MFEAVLSVLDVLIVLTVCTFCLFAAGCSERRCQLLAVAVAAAEAHDV
jgi:hypothetical protein